MVDRNDARLPARRPLWTVLATLSLVLLGASALQYGLESRMYAAANRFGREFAIDRRSPVDVKMSRLLPAGDLAADVLVQAALRDAGSEAPEIRTSGFRDSARANGRPRASSLADARELMLEAIRFRPGWVYHWFLLGRAVGASRRAEAPEHAPAPEMWIGPLVQATVAAPGLDGAWVALADAYLENWAALSSSDRVAAPLALRRAFHDPAVVSRDFPRTSSFLGRQQAISLLPGTTAALDAATDELFREGDIPGAARLIARRQNVERGERRADLIEIERLHRLGDSDGLWAACLAWNASHPPADCDDGPGRVQTARVLELWPASRGGSWVNDPRGKIVRFFLAGRESDVAGEALARSLDSLSGVPDAVRARVMLLAGNLVEAQEIADRSADPNDPDWRPYFLQLARVQLRGRRPRDAVRALDSLDSDGGEDCDTLLVRRDAAQKLGNRTEIAALDERLTAIEESSLSIRPGFGSGEATLPLCIDPASATARSLTADIQVPSSAVVTFGWDRGRAGVLFIPGNSGRVHVPLKGISGMREFSVRTLAGGPVRQLHISLTEPGG